MKRVVFNPFGDYATAGYLRNHLQEKNLDLIKQAEHELFRAQLPTPYSDPEVLEHYHDFEQRRNYKL